MPCTWWSRSLWKRKRCFTSTATLTASCYAGWCHAAAKPWRLRERHFNNFDDPVPLLRQLLPVISSVSRGPQSLCACPLPAEPPRRNESALRRSDMQRQLVCMLAQEAASGRFALRADEHSVRNLLFSAASLGQLHELELFASLVPTHLASPALARSIMLGALRGGLLSLVCQAAAAATEQPSAALAGILGPHLTAGLLKCCQKCCMRRAAVSGQRWWSCCWMQTTP